MSMSFREVAKTYGLRFKVDRGNESIYAKDIDGKWVKWIERIYDEEQIVAIGDTEKLNILLADTKITPTPEGVERFLSDLNESVMAEPPFAIRELIAADDWQIIAGVEDAYSDSRYTEQKPYKSVVPFRSGNIFID